MPAHFLVPLEDFSSTPSHLIGERAVFFGKLFDKKVNVPAMVCVPKSTWAEIVEKSGIEKKISKFLVDTKGLSDRVIHKKVFELLLALPLSKKFLEDLHIVYNRYFGHSFVTIFSSNLESSAYHHESIIGEANFIESITSCWAESVINNLRKKEYVSLTTVLSGEAIIAQLQPTAISSGVAYAQQPFDSDTQRIYIEALFGEYPHGEETCLDSFELDYNTYTVIKRSICDQKIEYRRSKEGFKKLNLPKLKGSSQKISDKDLSSLANLAHDIKKMSVNHSKMYWVQTSSGLFITQKESYFHDHNSYSSSVKTQNTPGYPLLLRNSPYLVSQQYITKTITKLYISGKNYQKAASECSEIIDGVGLLTGDQIVEASGIHPSAFSHKKKSLLIKKEIEKLITKYRNAVPTDSPVIYRTLSLDSQKLRSLQDGEKYSEQETNPTLGIKGASMALSQPSYFLLELEAIKDVIIKSSKPLYLMVNTVRTPTELLLLFDHIKKSGLTQHKQFGVWMELDTPENILNLTHYPLQILTGVSLNIKTLHSLCLGLDPDNAQLTSKYDASMPLIIKLLSTISVSLQTFAQEHPTAKKPSFIIQMEDFNPRVIEAGVQFGAQAFTVKPAVATIAKQSIIEAEAKPLQKNVQLR